MDHISVAEIGGVMLNAIFLDAIDSDAERMSRVNQTLSLLTEEQRKQHPHLLRKIPLLVFRPSQDLGAIVSDELQRLPGVLRYLMKGIGVSGKGGSDFLSYIAFDTSYTTRLIEIGHADALARRDEVTAFFQG